MKWNFFIKQITKTKIINNSFFKYACTKCGVCEGIYPSKIRYNKKNDTFSLKEKFNYKEFNYEKADSLKVEINNFVLSCIGRGKPLVDGEQGMNAVKTATLISESLWRRLRYLTWKINILILPQK